MPWHWEPMKDGANTDMPWGAVSKHRSMDFRMEQSGRSHVLSPYTEYIGIRGEPPELKHLSRARKRNPNRRTKGCSSEKERKVNALALRADEGRG